MVIFFFNSDKSDAKMRQTSDEMICGKNDHLNIP